MTVNSDQPQASDGQYDVCRIIFTEASEEASQLPQPLPEFQG